MAFRVTVEIIEPYAKVILAELNSQGEPRDNREWYTNISYNVPDNGNIELDEESMEVVLADLLAQRDVTLAEEEANGDLIVAVEDWLDGKLPE